MSISLILTLTVHEHTTRGTPLLEEFATAVPMPARSANLCVIDGFETVEAAEAAGSKWLDQIRKAHGAPNVRASFVISSDGWGD